MARISPRNRMIRLYNIVVCTVAHNLRNCLWKMSEIVCNPISRRQSVLAGRRNPFSPRTQIRSGKFFEKIFYVGSHPVCCKQVPPRSWSLALLLGHISRGAIQLYWRAHPPQEEPSPSSVYHLDARDNTRALWSHLLRQRNAFRNAKSRPTQAHETD